MSNTRYSLCIGVNGYKAGIGPLRFSVTDATKLEEALNTRRGGFTATESKILSDDGSEDYKPTKTNIMDSIVHLCGTASYDDTIIVYFSGHGTVIDGKCYLLPIDASSRLIRETSIEWDWIRIQMEKSVSRKKIMIIDACHSGTGKDINTSTQISHKVIGELIRSSTENFVCLTSCDGGQLSYESPQISQSIFSYYLVQGILGGADPLQRGIIDIQNLYNFVRERTLYLASQIGVLQEPLLISKVSIPLNSFIVASTNIDRLLNSVLVLTEDPLIGTLLQSAIQSSKNVNSVTWRNDVNFATSLAQRGFEYDAVFVDVRSNWQEKEQFINQMRKKYPTAPFVLIGSRRSFVKEITKEESERYLHYFFFDTITPIERIMTSVSDILNQVIWDIEIYYGKSGSSITYKVRPETRLGDIPLEISTEKGLVYYYGKDITHNLSPLHYKALCYLWEKRGTVCSIASLSETLHPGSDINDYESTRILMRRLRRLLAQLNPDHPVPLSIYRTRGYRLDVPVTYDESLVSGAEHTLTTAAAEQAHVADAATRPQDRGDFES